MNRYSPSVLIMVELQSGHGTEKNVYVNLQKKRVLQKRCLRKGAEGSECSVLAYHDGRHDNGSVIHACGVVGKLLGFLLQNQFVVTVPVADLQEEQSIRTRTPSSHAKLY